MMMMMMIIVFIEAEWFLDPCHYYCLFFPGPVSTRMLASRDLRIFNVEEKTNSRKKEGKQTEPETDTEKRTVTKGNSDRDRVKSSHPIKSQFGSGCQNKLSRCNNCLVSNFHINIYDCQSQILLFPFWAADERIYIIESLRVVVRVSVLMIELKSAKTLILWLIACV